jgi:hypothetical protein
MEINFTGGAYKGRSTNLNAQVCQNFFPIIDNQDGKSILSLMGTPGLKLWKDLSDTGESRGSILWDNSLFVVIGNTLYKLATNGTKTNVGTLGTSSGRVYLAGGVAHLMVVGGGKGYYQISGATALTEITDTDFPTPTSCAYLDGFFLVSEDGSDSVYKSASEDASDWDGLDFASAEDQPDDVELIHAYKRHLMLYGTDTTEIFYNTGDASFPFTRVAGAVIPIGLNAAASVASGAEGMFFLDSNLQVRMWQGYETIVISTEQVDYQIRSYATTTDAVGYTYTQEGHSFYVLTFPTDSRTWVFDIITGFWHTRSSGVTSGRHLSDGHQWFAGKNLVVGHSDGIIYELDLDTFVDNGRTLESIRAAQVVQSGRKLVFHNQLEIDFEAGVGIATGQGSDPQAMLDWSDDGGHTWGNEHWADIGKIGEYTNRAIWRRLGSSRNRIYRVSITDPVKRVIMGAHLEAEVGNG